MNKTTFMDVRTVPAVMTDHARAAAEWLEHFAKELRCGKAPEDIGWMVEKIGVMMARKI